MSYGACVYAWQGFHSLCCKCMFWLWSGISMILTYIFTRDHSFLLCAGDNKISWFGRVLYWKVPWYHTLSTWFMGNIREWTRSLTLFWQVNCVTKPLLSSKKYFINLFYPEYLINIWCSSIRVPWQFQVPWHFRAKEKKSTNI